MSLVKICAIGAGRAGLVHVRNFVESVPQAKLVAVVDANREAAEKAALDYQIERVYADYRQALAEGGFDGVVITTPTFTHAEIAIAAAQAGMHVLCEKPMALSLEECDQMIAAAQTSRVVFQLGFMRRFDSAFRNAKQRILAGEIGKVMLVKSTGRGPGLPPRWACDIKKSHGMLAEVNSHDFDSVRWLSGSEYRRVYAEADAFKCSDLKLEFPDFYDNALVSCRMHSGALAVIDGACPADYGYDARVEILGSEGVMLIGELPHGAVSVCKKGTGIVRSTFPSWRDRFRQGYIEEDRHFVACIQEGRPPEVTAQDGKMALQAVIAANRSIVEARPIEIPFPD